MRSLTLIHQATCAAAATVVFLAAAPLVAGADTAMASPAPIDCSQTSMMMDRAAKMPPPAMTGDVDHDTMMMMQMHTQMAMQMARVEAVCGKDPQKRAAAQKLIDDSVEFVTRINHLTGSY